MATAPGAAAHAAPAAPDGWRRWEFGPLPETRQVTRAGVSFTIWPALRDSGDAVALVEARSLPEAQQLSRQGLTRLAVLALPQLARHIVRRTGEDRTLILLTQGLAATRPLAESCMETHLPGMLFRSGRRTAARRAGVRVAAGRAPRAAG